MTFVAVLQNVFIGYLILTTSYGVVLGIITERDNPSSFEDRAWHYFTSALTGALYGPCLIPLMIMWG